MTIENLQERTQYIFNIVATSNAGKSDNEEVHLQRQMVRLFLLVKLNSVF